MIKKISVAILLLGFTTFAQAEYQMNIGMTDKHRGSLPDNSVVFKNKNSTTPPPVVTPPVVEPPIVTPPAPTIECKLEDGVYSWRTTVPGSVQSVFWAGEALRSHVAQVMDTEFVWDGYKYMRGEVQNTAGPRLWSICRIAV